MKKKPKLTVWHVLTTYTLLMVGAFFLPVEGAHQLSQILGLGLVALIRELKLSEHLPGPRKTPRKSRIKKEED